MKKSGFILFLVVFAFSFNVAYLRADCKDIEGEAKKVKAKVNAITKDRVDVDIEIENLTENLYVKVLSDYNEEVKTYTYDNVNKDTGLIVFPTDSLANSVKYVVRVYSKDEICGLEPLASLDFSTPKFNPFSINNQCKGNEDIDMCNPFYDTKDMSFQDFNEKLDKKVVEANRTVIEKVLIFLASYWYFIVIPIVVIVGIYIFRIRLLKRGNEDK